MTSLPISQHLSFTNKQGEKLVGILDIAQKSIKKDLCLVFLHGYLSEKEGPVGLALANTLPQQRISLFRFDFSGNGESEGEFGEGSFSKMRSDTLAALDLLKKQGFKKFAILGHSFGSAIALTLMPEHIEIRYFISLSGAGDLPASKKRRFSKEALLQADQLGYTYLTLPSGKKEKVSREYVEDFDRYDIAAYAHKASVPGLFLWGRNDTTIPEKEVRLIYDAYDGQKAFSTIDDADHFFITEKEQETMNVAVADWLTRQIKE